MNLEQVDSLIEKMERASLTELSYKDKDVDIKLKENCHNHKFRQHQL